MGEYELAWARAFLLTLAIEFPLYLWLLRREGWSVKRAASAGLLANAVSHPVLWFLVPALQPYWVFLLVGEAVVIAIELAVTAAIARRLSWGLAGIVVTVNLVSMGLGIVLGAGI